MTIYLDQLLLCSFFANYLLFRLTLTLTHTPYKHPALLFVATLASLSSLLMLTPLLPFLNSLLAKVLITALFALLISSQPKQKFFLANFFVLFLLSFLLSGIIHFINTLLSPLHCAKFTSPHSAPPWFSLAFSLILLVLFTILYRKHLYHHPPMHATVTFFYRNQTVQLSAIIDSGNLLIDPALDTPVIISCCQYLSPILPADLYEALTQNDLSIEQILTQFPQYHLRLIPYRTLEHTALLCAFTLSSCTILTDDAKIYHISRPTLALSPHPINPAYQAIIPYNLLK